MKSCMSMQGMNSETLTLTKKFQKYASNTTGLPLCSLPQFSNSQVRFIIGLYLACNVGIGASMVYMDILVTKPPWNYTYLGDPLNNQHSLTKPLFLPFYSFIAHLGWVWFLLFILFLCLFILLLLFFSCFFSFSTICIPTFFSLIYPPS